MLVFIVWLLSVLWTYFNINVSLLSDLQENYNIRSGFPPTYGQILPISGCADWLDCDPHMAYIPPGVIFLSRWGK